MKRSNQISGINNFHSSTIRTRRSPSIQIQNPSRSGAVSSQVAGDLASKDGLLLSRATFRKGTTRHRKGGGAANDPLEGGQATARQASQFLWVHLEIIIAFRAKWSLWYPSTHVETRRRRGGGVCAAREPRWKHVYLVFAQPGYTDHTARLATTPPPLPSETVVKIRVSGKMMVVRMPYNIHATILHLEWCY